MNKLILSTVFLLLLFNSDVEGQLYNDGAMITIQSGALVHIQGNFTNQGGEIRNEGLIEIGGDWENSVMSFPMTPGSGVVRMVGTDQLVGRDFPTLFNDLVLDSNQNVSLTSNIGIGNLISLNDGIIVLDRNVLHLIKGTPDALEVGSGGVLAETSDAYGFVRWDIGVEEEDDYSIPFITSADDHISVSFDILAPGTDSLGFLLFSTYATNSENIPLPLGIFDLNIDNSDVGLESVDRFWIVAEQEYTSSPELNLQVIYAANEVLPPNEILADRLEPIRWDTLDGWGTVGPVVISGNSASFNLDTYGTLGLRSRITTSVSDIFGNNRLHVYPNPTSDFLLVDLESPVKGEFDIVIFDSSGKRITSEFIPQGAGNSSFRMALDNLDTGLYLLSIEGKEVRAIETFQVIK